MKTPMDNLTLIPKEKIDAEVARVKAAFCTDFKKKFMKNDESYYAIARESGKDTGAVKDLLSKPGDCHLRSAIQILYHKGYTVRMLIEPLKNNNSNGQDK